MSIIGRSNQSRSIKIYKKKYYIHITTNHHFFLLLFFIYSIISSLLKYWIYKFILLIKWRHPIYFLTGKTIKREFFCHRLIAWTFFYSFFVDLFWLSSDFASIKRYISRRLLNYQHVIIPEKNKHYQNLRPSLLLDLLLASY